MSKELCREEPVPQMEDGPTVNEEVAVSSTAKRIEISPLNYGYAVNVGCQSFAIENLDTLLNMISKYLKDPKTVEKQWFNKQLEIK